MSEFNSIDTAPKDGSKFEVQVDGEFPIEAYYGGGEDQAIRSWVTCRQVINPLGWRNIGERVSDIGE